MPPGLRVTWEKGRMAGEPHCRAIESGSADAEGGESLVCSARVAAMWTCGNCREVLEDQFDACWSCGCSRDGKLDLAFVREPPSDDAFVREPPSDDHDSPVSREFARYFICRRCRHRKARCKRIAMRPAPWSGLFAEDFLAVSCCHCGLTEFYSLTVLEGRLDLGNFPRSIFGG
jgi:predicted nucleic-acid-binding Zn-ribbon protein